MALQPNQKKVIDQCSRGAVENALSSQLALLRTRVWVASGNRYAEQTVKRVRDDYYAPGSGLKSADFQDYMIASIPLHATDGWSFLGRAAQAHVHGDADAARHLAYYAELRAALALLGSEGLAVLQDDHFALTAPSKLRRIPTPPRLGTHYLVWAALEHWSDQAASAGLLTSIVAPGQIPLTVWMAAFSSGATTPALVGKRLLRQWGVDLQRLADDREARNDSSYRPTRIFTRPHISASERAQFLEDMWSGYQPFPASPFEIIDRHVLRLSLEQTFMAQTNLSAAAAKGKPLFRLRVEKMLGSINPTILGTAEWISFLTRSSEPQDLELLVAARLKLATSNPKHHIGVMARAGLLLRLATGACARLFQVAGVGSKDLEFWWQPYGAQFGLWEPGSVPTQLTDLWADVADALVDLGGWRASAAKSEYSFLKEQSAALIQLATCERVALWGLGL